MSKHKPPLYEPYVAATDVLADLWTILVTREAFFGAKRFDDFFEHINIPRARLSERLKHLLNLGLLTKEAYQANPLRYEYHLTAMGLGTYPIALALIHWGDSWRPAANRIRLQHKSCGHLLKANIVCRECNTKLQHSDIIWPASFPLDAFTAQESTVRMWRRKLTMPGLSDRPDSVQEAFKAIGDRWSMLLIYAAQQTEFRFGEVRDKLGLADNILSDRLKHLQAENILERTSNTRSSPYCVTEAGRALLPALLAARDWAIEWLQLESGEWSVLKHSLCGHVVRTKCICDACCGEINPRDITLAN